METIPALIVNVTEQDSAVLALIENIQRENLNFMEEARGYAHLIKDYELRQQDLADQLGKGQSTIANKLRLLQLPEEIQNKIMEAQLSERHARALLALKNEEQQLEAMAVIVEKQLNVKETEKLIKDILENKTVKKGNKDEGPVIKRYLKDIRLFTNTIKQAVDMVQSAGVEVDYNLRQTEDSYEISITIPIDK